MSDDGVPSWDELVRIFRSSVRTASSQLVQDEDAPYEIDRDRPPAP